MNLFTITNKEGFYMEKTLDELFNELKEILPTDMPEPIQEMLVNGYRFLIGQ